MARASAFRNSVRRYLQRYPKSFWVIAAAIVAVLGLSFFVRNGTNLGELLDDLRPELIGIIITVFLIDFTRFIHDEQKAQPRIAELLRDCVGLEETIRHTICAAARGSIIQRRKPQNLLDEEETLFGPGLAKLTRQLYVTSHCNVSQDPGVTWDSWLTQQFKEITAEIDNMRMVHGQYMDPELFSILSKIKHCCFIAVGQVMVEKRIFQNNCRLGAQLGLPYSEDFDGLTPLMKDLQVQINELAEQCDQPNRDYQKKERANLWVLQNSLVSVEKGLEPVKTT